ncbi:PREDICTED: uncharacterized protein LOC108771733 [Cyphomyrmex costatus]|uniref:Uncharacterized protein n=1 Tax=Cyphomyrmex costatus TaxID=456900 RepID=A0A195D6X0_9HYME|nr:PREDICTED: uncharacterized protein LOC108771733 [Cyphomyrmex costatus]KYN08635.1 hypothetical protein ALC62_00306 [Cyphomyrmex costatus]
MYIRNETVQRQDISIRESVSLEGKMICDISNELATVVDTKVNYHRSPTLCVLKEITEPTDIASENIPHISSGENSNNEAPNDDTGGFEVDVCTPKKRRVAEPRFISEICVSDVATPRRAKRVITLVKQNDAKKREQIKQLHRQNRKLLKRITYLEDMMKNTKLETLYNVYM